MWGLFTWEVETGWSQVGTQLGVTGKKLEVESQFGLEALSQDPLKLNERKNICLLNTAYENVHSQAW